MRFGRAPRNLSGAPAFVKVHDRSRREWPNGSLEPQRCMGGVSNQRIRDMGVPEKCDIRVHSWSTREDPGSKIDRVRVHPSSKQETRQIYARGARRPLRAGRTRAIFAASPHRLATDGREHALLDPGEARMFRKDA